MLTGVGLEADAEGTEPIAKKAIIHSTIAAEKNVLCRMISMLCRRSVFIFFIILIFPFVVLAFFGFSSWEAISGRSLMYCAKFGRALRGK